jgi:hypothetical protein
MATRKTSARKTKASSRRSRPSAAKGRASEQRYGDLAGAKVERAMQEMKRGVLRSGRSGKKVTNPRQAIAIGLSEARQAGGKVPRARAT